MNEWPLSNVKSLASQRKIHFAMSSVLLDIHIPFSEFKWSRKLYENKKSEKIFARIYWPGISLSLSLHPSPISLSLFSLLFLSSDVDHIKIIHVTNWSSHCPWPLIPNSPASQSTDVLLGIGFVFSGSKVTILVNIIYVCQHFSWDNCYRYLRECDLYKSMTSHHTLNVPTWTYPSST